MVCEVLVEHTEGDFLIMKRSPNKPLHPNCYEASAGGSAVKGEDKLTCIKRELFEETGILATDFTELSSKTTNNRIYHHFLTVTNCDKNSIILQEGETCDYLWLSKSEFIDFLQSENMVKSNVERILKYLKEKV